VRPIGRTTLLVARFAAASAVCVVYVELVFAAAVLITGATGDWWPTNPELVGLGLGAAVVIVVAISLLGSTVLSTTANGIAVFMVFGAGLAAGLLGQVGEALSSDTLNDIASIASWALPFEALYQSALHSLTEDITGVTGVAVSLGPFGGAQEASSLLWLFAIAYVVVVGAVADLIFRRSDL
jgi:Cu-processing system permease protein